MINVYPHRVTFHVRVTRHGVTDIYGFFILCTPAPAPKRLTSVNLPISLVNLCTPIFITGTDFRINMLVSQHISAPRSRANINSNCQILNSWCTASVEWFGMLINISRMSPSFRVVRNNLTLLFWNMSLWVILIPFIECIDDDCRMRKTLQKLGDGVSTLHRYISRLPASEDPPRNMQYNPN